MDWKQLEELETRLNCRPPALRGVGKNAAVLALVAGDRLVLEVRSKALRHQPGEVCMPGGRMEEGESPVACALRETREELGLDVSQCRVIGPLDVLFHSNGRIVSPVLAVCPPQLLEGLSPSPGEVGEVFTVPLDWFRQHPPTHYRYRMECVDLEGLPEQMIQWLHSYRFHREGSYWQYEDKLIWGVTARAIQEVLEVLAPEG